MCVCVRENRESRIKTLVQKKERKKGDRKRKMSVEIIQAEER